MPYDIPNFDDTRNSILRDTRNLDATAPTDVDSDNYIRATATASAVEGLYDHQAWMVRQIIPDTADPEYLEQHCALRGITRRPATKATGTITVTGRPGSVVPAYTQAKDADGNLYQTTTAITLAGNDEAVSAAAPCEAVQAGALPDVEGATATLVSAPSGVQAKAALTLAGGTDAEGKGDQLLQERIAQLAVAFLERGGISHTWLKRYAALAGYDITIDEFTPFKAGLSCAGDPLTNDDWSYAFRVNAPADAPRVFRAGQSVAGEALRTWGDSILECIINQRKPAHAVALVAYT